MQPPSSAQPTFIDRLIRRKRALSDAPSPAAGERRQQQRRKDERRRDESILQDAQASLRCGNPNRSLRVLVEWLSERGDQAEDYAWLCSRIASWDDARQINHLTQERVARLLTLKRTDEVLELMVQRLTTDKTFRPKTSADTLKVAQLAARSGHARIAQALLSDFAARFKGDPRIPAAYALKQQLSAPAQHKEKSA
jgi:hypothetical protein